RLDEILASLPLFRATFARHFKRSTGKTFSSFLAEVRIDHACHAVGMLHLHDLVRAGLADDRNRTAPPRS
ncbi:MAG: hypothetical protein ACC662_08290, partial [Planctomycetota bacterium]